MRMRHRVCRPVRTIWAGMSMMAARKVRNDTKHRSTRQQFVDDAIEVIPIVDYDATVATTHAELLVAVRRQGRPRGAHHLIIAATAKATQREVVSADRSAYDDLSGIAVRTHRP